jgi:uncharacterized membrane protein YfcA
MLSIFIIKLLLLALAATIAGCIDTIAGGGGLICVPALLLAGIPPTQMLATNKFQATFGTGMATYKFLQYGGIAWREVLLGCIFCLIGATIGSLCIQHMDQGFLQTLLPYLLIGVLIYMLLTPKAGEIKRHAYIKSGLFFTVFGLLLGFYDGFFGPGTGSFWVVAMVGLLGFDLRHATMHAKVYNFISNLIALFWFILGGHVLYIVGFTMAIGQLLGAKIGAWLVIHKGTKLIRPLFITMVSVMLLSLLYKHYIH